MTAHQNPAARRHTDSKGGLHGPALIQDVMRVLHARVDHGLSLSLPMRKHTIEAALYPREFGVLDALRGAAELGYVKLINLGSTSDGIEAVLTDEGREWGQDVGDDGVTWDGPLLYAYENCGVLTVSTLQVYANAWEQGYYSGHDGLTRELLTFANRTGYRVIVDKMPSIPEDEWFAYRLWAAGEQVAVQVDARP